MGPRLLTTLILLTVATPLTAWQPYPDVTYTRVLIPTRVGAPQPGLFGSLWTSHVTVTNNAAVAVSVFGYMVEGGQCDLCFAPRLTSGKTYPDFGVYFDRAGARGAFLYVDREHLADVNLTLRVQDISRQAQTFGTTIPVVPETGFRDTTFSLADLTGSQLFRTTVRVYSSDPKLDTDVRFRLFAIATTGDVLLADRVFTLPRVDFDQVTFFPYPGYLEIPDLNALADARTFDRLRLEITGNHKIWAFATVTHNETQHMTVIAPTP